METPQFKIGFDFGTDNSCLTYLDELGRPFIIQHCDNYLINSSLLIENNETYLFGNEIDFKYIYEKPIFTNFKRIIGLNENSDEVIKLSNKLNIQIKNGINNDLEIIIENKKYSYDSLLCIFLSKIKKLIDITINSTYEIIITIPISFNNFQQDKLLNYCNNVGLICNTLLYEPYSVGYALFFCLNNNNINNSKKIVIFDLGPGTLDISLISCFNDMDINNFEDNIEFLINIENSISDNNLGGYDINLILEKYFIETYSNLSEYSYKEISKLIEEIKINLSNNLQDDNIFSFNKFILTITKKKYYELLDYNFKDKIISKLNILHKDESDKNIDDIFMIGKNTYNPWFNDLISNYYNKEIKDNYIKVNTFNSQLNINFKEIAVSLGAACINHKKSCFDNKLVILEKNKYDIGIEVFGGLMCPIIFKNSIIPSFGSKSFKPQILEENYIEIKIYEGNNTLVADNIYMGKLIIENINIYSSIILNINISVGTDNLVVVECKTADNYYNNKIVLNRKNINYTKINYETNNNLNINIITKYYELINKLTDVKFNLFENLFSINDVKNIINIIDTFIYQLFNIKNLFQKLDNYRIYSENIDFFINYFIEKLNLNYNFSDIIIDEDKIEIEIQENLDKILNVFKNKLSILNMFNNDLNINIKKSIKIEKLIEEEKNKINQLYSELNNDDNLKKKLIDLIYINYIDLLNNEKLFINDYDLYNYFKIIIEKIIFLQNNFLTEKIYNNIINLNMNDSNNIKLFNKILYFIYNLSTFN